MKKIAWNSDFIKIEAFLSTLKMSVIKNFNNLKILVHVEQLKKQQKKLSYLYCYFSIKYFM